MDYKHTIDILAENIKEIANIIDGFAENQQIPALDLDLVLAKTRNLYDVFLMLKKYAVETPHEEERENIDLKPDISVPETKPEADDSIKPKEKETSYPESVNDKKSKPDEESDEEKNEESVAPKTLSDRFKKQSTSLHDNLIQSKSYYDLSTKLQSKGLTNINNAIGINDRFSFIQELFKGDAEKYGETMKILNNASDFNEAYNYLIENFQWDMNSESVQKILELIRRKFITSKDE